MSKILHALSARDSHLWTLRMALSFLFVLLLMLLFMLYSAQRQITVYVPPDLSRVNMLRSGEIPAPHIYAFALSIFQELNFWPNDGAREYPERIAKYHCYYTPRFHRWLEANLQEKRSHGELNRSRGLYSLVGYSEDRVRQTAADSWEVRLDLGLREWMQNRLVKDVALHYVLRVTVFAMSAECNPWGLALDGHVHLPQRIQSQ